MMEVQDLSLSALVPDEQIAAVYGAAEEALQMSGAEELATAICATSIVRCRRSFLVLPLLTAQATGGAPHQAVLVAAAHHLIGLAAGVLDEVQDGELDNAEWHAALDPPQAINTGVALIFAAQRVLARLTERGAAPAQVTALQTDFAHACYRMCAGQHLDLLGYAVEDAPLAVYWRIAAAKSGAFYALGARAGARLGADAGADLDPYTDYGQHLGLVVQAVNDLRGLVEAPATEPAVLEGTDLVQGRLTLPVAYGLSVAPQGVREELQSFLQRARTEPQAARRAAALLVELGALHYTLLVAEQHRRCAADALHRARGDPVFHEGLLALLDATIPVLDLAFQEQS
jgi:geranylgeranyl diphosphate synthase type I